MRLQAISTLMPLLAAAMVGAVGAAGAQQFADSTFDTHVAAPAFTSRHPKVLVDRGHNDYDTASGRYRAFADVAVSDGFQVFEDSNAFTAADLAGNDVLVIADAMGSHVPTDSAASAPAFTPRECDAVRDWVRAGGALLLIADHTPMGAAARPLARRFGVDFRNGFMIDPALDDSTMGASTLVYTRENGGLGAHPILTGRDDSERVHRVETFTGQSILGPPGSVALLKASDRAQDLMMSTKGVHGPVPDSLKRSAAGRAQGIAFTFGKGRVVMFGDAAMLTVQLSGTPDHPLRIGMNHPGIDNKQLELNVLHWLVGLLPGS